MKNKSLKILAIAYACNPYHGSEAGVGWGWINAISQYHELWVITGLEQGQKDIENYLKENPHKLKNVHFYYVSRKTNTKLLKHFPPYYFFTYQQWQKDAFTLAQELCEQVKFDIVHQITWVGYRTPGYLWKVNKPFVWGPIGGLENTPWRLLPALDVKGIVYYTARNLINSFQKRYSIAPKKAFQKAAIVIAATQGIQREIKKYYNRDSEIICEIGIPEIQNIAPSKRKESEPLRISWSGNHLPGKALHLLLKALGLLPSDVKWHLDILGDGPCTIKWKSLSQKLGIGKYCTWHGKLPRDKAIQRVHDSHVFVITSLYDLTSSVLIEAMSQGVPVIAFDHCGFSNVINDKCGIKIPVNNIAKIKTSIADAIEDLYNNEEKRRRLADGALKRIDEYSWDNKALLINHLYDKLLSIPRKH